MTDEEANEYNACHFWTNFEIARLDLWHTEAYQAFFDYLDKSGGFFYERYVYSLGLSSTLFTKWSQDGAMHRCILSLQRCI